LRRYLVAGDTAPAEGAVATAGIIWRSGWGPTFSSPTNGRS